jgi:hypothetical protein
MFGAIVGRPQVFVWIHARHRMATKSAPNARTDGLIQTMKRRSEG